MEPSMKLLNIDKNAKTVKGQSKGYMTAILYLAPANLSGYEVCPMATAGCRAACLNTAGRGAFSTTQKSRIAKTKRFFQDRQAFMAQLVDEITKFVTFAEKHGFIPTVRLNGTSDIVWERVAVGDHANVMAMFPTIQFYDYTKRSNRKDLPANYHLTFSLAEDNTVQAEKALDNGINVAAVFRVPQFPVSYFNRQVIDGDETDLRFLDPKGSVIGLKAKGKARKDTTGFVKEVA
jgi:hypothetical protein